ncbi:MAG TPA: hypothetical protein VNT79_00840 [Phycisphaerae bacterium]|nr:hypothetical protein [Phycisphaerae bacterium]
MAKPKPYIGRKEMWFEQPFRRFSVSAIIRLRGQKLARAAAFEENSRRPRAVIHYRHERIDTDGDSFQ